MARHTVTRRTYAAVWAMVMIASACMASDSGPSEELFREMQPRINSAVAGLTVYDQSPYMVSLAGRGSLTCHIHGEETYIRTARVKLSINGETVLSESGSSHLRLSDYLTAPVQVRTFQHSTYACIKVDIPEGVRIPASGHLQVDASFGDDGIEGLDLTGYNEGDHFSCESDYDVRNMQGPQTLVLTKSVQPEEAKHRLEWDMEDLVSEPAVKLLVDPSTGERDDVLFDNSTMTQTIEFLMPTHKFDVWMPPQVKDASSNYIRLYLPKALRSLKLTAWNVSWAIAGKYQFSEPIRGNPGEELIADGLQPDTTYQFRCCGIHDSVPSGRSDECEEITARTRSFVGASGYPEYESVGPPSTFPRHEGDGAFIKIPNHLSRTSPQTANLSAVFLDYETGRAMHSAFFEETGTHLVRGFPSEQGYRVKMTLTNIEGLVFHFEEVVKYGPRSATIIKPRLEGAPEVFRTAASVVLVDLPPKAQRDYLSTRPPARMARAEVSIYNSITRDLIHSETYNEAGQFYIRQLPGGTYTIRIAVTYDNQVEQTFLFVLNPVWEDATADRTVGDVVTRVNNAGEIIVNIPVRLTDSSPAIDIVNVTATNPLSTEVLGRLSRPASSQAVFRLPRNVSVTVTAAVTDEAGDITIFETMVNRAGELLVPPMTETVGRPKMVAVTPTAFTIMVPPRRMNNDPLDVMRVNVYVTDALLGKLIRASTIEGAGAVTVNQLPANEAYNVRVAVKHGSVDQDEAEWREEEFFFVPRPAGLPLYLHRDPVSIHIRSVPTNPPTQRVVVRLPHEGTQLDGYGTYGRVDVMIYGYPLEHGRQPGVIKSADNTTDDVEDDSQYAEKRELLMTYVGCEVGDTVIENLPDASTMRLTATVKVWTDAVMKTRPFLQSEQIFARDDRRREVLKGKASPNSHRYAGEHAPAQPTPSPTEALGREEMQVLLQHGKPGNPLSKNAPEFDPIDGSFPVSYNASWSGRNAFRKKVIAQQFASATPVRLPSQPQFGGATFVPTSAGAVVRVAGYFCETCARIKTVVVRATTAVPGKQGTCKGRNVGMGEWEAGAEEEVYIPMPEGVDVDVCLEFTDVVGKRTRQGWHLPATRAEGAPPHKREGKPEVLPLDQSRIVARVPMVHFRETKAKRTIQPPPMDATLKEVAMHEQLLRALAASDIRFNVLSCALTVRRTDTHAMVAHVPNGVVADNVVGVPADAPGFVVEFELAGKTESGQEMRDTVTIVVANDHLSTPASSPPMPATGPPELFCQPDTNTLVLRVPERLSPGEEFSPIERVEYELTSNRINATVLTSGTVFVGDTPIPIPGAARHFRVRAMMFDTAGGNLTSYAYATCAPTGFPPMPAIGNLDLLPTLDGALYVRVPPRLLATESPVEGVTADLRECGSDDVIYRLDSPSGGDFRVPRDKVKPVGCYNLTANVTVPGHSEPFVLTGLRVVFEGAFLPPLRLEGEAAYVPLGHGAVVARVPRYLEGEDRSRAPTGRTITVTVEHPQRERADWTLLRGADHVMLTHCWEDDCVLSSAEQVLEEAAYGESEDERKAGGSTRKIPLISALLTFVPHPNDPDVWTPTPTTLVVDNPVPQELQVEVVAVAAGQVVTKRTTRQRGKITITGLERATNYKVRLEYAIDGSVVKRERRVKTPVRDLDISREAGGEGWEPNLPYPVSVTTGSTKILIQAPELVAGKPTRHVTAVAKEWKDPNANKDYSNRAQFASDAKPLRAELSMPQRGEVFIIDGAKPKTSYDVEVVATNEDGNTERTVQRVETTRVTEVWNSAHVVVRKGETDFTVRPASNLPGEIISFTVACEDTANMIPRLVYDGGPIKDTEFDVDGLVSGHRYRVGWSMRSRNATYFDTCAWLTMDFPREDESPIPRVVRVTHDQVYLALPHTVDNLDYWAVHLVDYRTEEKHRETRRTSLYEGAGYEFSETRQLKVYIARMLNSDTNYSFTVQAHLRDGTTLEPTVLHAITDSTFIPCVVGRPMRPAAPVLVPGTNKDRKFTLLWNYMTKNEGPNPDAYPTSSYALEVKDTEFDGIKVDAPWEFESKNISYLKNHYTFKNMIPAYEYQIRLTAYNFWGQSDAGHVLTVRPPDEVPEPVPDLTFNGMTSRSVQLTWNEPYHNGQFVQGYKVECSPRPDSSPLLYPADQYPNKAEYGIVYIGPSRNVTVDEFVPASNITCQVRARNVLGYGKIQMGESNGTFYTRTDRPEKIVNLRPEVVGRYYTNILFDKPRHNGLPIMGYDIALKRPGEEFKVECDDTPDAQCPVGTLLPGDTYKFKVQAANCRGSSTWSDVLSVRMLSAPPDPPTGIRLTDSSPVELSLDWDIGRHNGEIINLHSLECDGGATCITPADWVRGVSPHPCMHHGQAAAVSDEELVADDTLFREVWRGYDSKCTIRELIPATTYRCRPFAHNLEGRSNVTDFVAFRTDNTVPDPPPDFVHSFLSLDHVTNTFRVALQWAFPAPNGRPILEYEVQRKNQSRMMSSSGLPVADAFSAASSSGYQWNRISPERHLNMSFLAGPLVPDRKFHLRVKAINDLGSGAWTDLDIKTPPGRPEAPGALKLNRKTRTSLELTCPLIDDAGSRVHTYNVEISAGVTSQHNVGTVENATFSPWQVMYTGEERRVEIGGLEEGTNYKTRCSMVNDIGVSPYSNMAMYTTLSGPPDTPEIAQARDPIATGYDLFYTYQVPDDNGLRITRCEVEVGGTWEWDMEAFDANRVPDEKRVSVIEGYTHPYQDSYTFDATGLLPGHEYSLRTRCWNSMGPGGWSDPLYMQTEGVPPEAPYAAKVVGTVGKRNLTLNLGYAFDNGDALTSTDVEWECLDGQCPISQCATGAVNGAVCADPIVQSSCNTICSEDGPDCDECVVENLLPGTLYRFWSYASNIRGRSQPGQTLEVRTAPDRPSAPTAFQAVPTTPTVAALSWAMPDTINGAELTAFVVKWQCDTEDEPRCAMESLTLAPTAFTADIGDLLPGFNYEFQVLAENAVGHSPEAFVRNVRAPADRPAPPGRPKLWNQLPDELLIKWDAPGLNGASTVTYTVQWSAVGEYAFANNQAAGLASTSHSIGGLSVDKMYQFRVKATNAGGYCSEPNDGCGESDWSLLSAPLRVQTQCPINPETSPGECSNQGFCDTKTYRCICEGNYIGDSCQYPMTRGICNVQGSEVTPFANTESFTHSFSNEYVMLENSLLGGERVTIWKDIFTVGNGVAITKVAMMYEGQKLTIQLDQNDPNACPYVRHNCRDVDYEETGKYVAIEKTDAQGEGLGEFKMLGSCYGSMFVLENTITRTKVWCERYRKDVDPNAPMYFASCYLSANRRFCKEGDCDPFATETGLCGKHGRSQIEGPAITLPAVTGTASSLFVDADMQLCTDAPVTEEESTTTLVQTDVGPESEIIELVQSAEGATPPAHARVTASHVTTPTTSTTTTTPHRPVAPPHDPRPQVATAAPHAQPADANAPSFAKLRVRGVDDVSPYSEAVREGATRVLAQRARTMQSRLDDQRRHDQLAQQRKAATQRKTQSRISRRDDTLLAPQAAIQSGRTDSAELSAGMQAMAQLMANLEATAMSNNPTPSNASSTTEDDDAMLDGIAAKPPALPPTCPEECDADVCEYAQVACKDVSTCKRSCLNNICNANCRGGCKYDWVGMAKKCDADMKAAVTEAQQELAGEIQQAHSFFNALRQGHTASVSQCPEYVSGNEPWNVYPADREVESWVHLIPQPPALNHTHSNATRLRLNATQVPAMF